MATDKGKRAKQAQQPHNPFQGHATTTRRGLFSAVKPAILSTTECLLCTFSPLRGLKATARAFTARFVGVVGVVGVVLLVLAVGFVGRMDITGTGLTYIDQTSLDAVFTFSGLSGGHDTIGIPSIPSTKGV